MTDGARSTVRRQGKPRAPRLCSACRPQSLEVVLYTVELWNHLTTLKDRHCATANTKILPPHVNTLNWIIPYGRTNNPLVNRST